MKPSWPSGLRRCNFPVVDWPGVGSNPAGDIYFHFEFFAPSPFRTGQRCRCKWNQACPYTWSHSCFRPQIWLIIQGLVYKYLQYSFNTHFGNFNYKKKAHARTVLSVLWLIFQKESSPSHRRRFSGWPGGSSAHLGVRVKRFVPY